MIKSLLGITPGADVLTQIGADSDGASPMSAGTGT